MSIYSSDLVLLLAMIINLDVLFEEHALLKVRSEAPRVGDTMLMVLSDLPFQFILVHSLEVPLVDYFFEETGPTIFII